MNGSWSEAKGGSVNCPLKYPMYLTAKYEYPYLTLSWRAVDGAVRYAIRIDDAVRSPGVFSPIPFDADKGDRLNDNLPTNSYTFKVGRERQFSFWVHAIDKYGVWSNSSKWAYITTK